MTPVRCAVGLLKLNRFRNHAAASIDTGGASVALYGANGTGKTNVLEAVSLLVPGRGLRRAPLEDMARRPDGSAWRVRAEAEGMEGAVGLTTGGGDGTGARPVGRTVEIDGAAAAQSALGDHLCMVWLTPAMDRLWIEGAGGRRRFLDRATLGFFPDHGEVSLNYDKAMRDRNRLLKTGEADPAWLSALEARMGRCGARIARARALTLDRLSAAQDASCALFPKAGLAIVGPMENRFAEVIRARGPEHGSETDRPARDRAENTDDALDDALDRVEAGEAADLTRDLASGRGRDQAAGRTLTGPHRADLDAVYAAKDTAARVCSTGEQKALLISLILANVRALAASGVVPILLLDEVAAHLDPARRAALHAEVAALGCQTWMTGTEPDLFADLPAAALRIETPGGLSGRRNGVAAARAAT